LIFFETEEELRKMPESSVKKELLYKFKKALTKIKDWKNHIIRGWCQDQPKYFILNEIETKGSLSKLVYIHGYWAMKWLPQLHGKTQKHFFAKRAIPWHITCVMYSEEDVLSFIAFVHIFKSNRSQDVNSVVGVYDSVFEDLYDYLGKYYKVYIFSIYRNI
jgi:hypothetical protein